MNSFRSLERAVDFEIGRQIEVVEAGGTIVQETRHWDEGADVTHSMRTKEGSSDYRYFSEPDLVPMVMSDQWVSEIRESLPELPAERRVRYIDSGLEPDAAGVLSDAAAPLRRVFEDAVGLGADPRQAANWVIGEVTAWLRRESVDAGDMRLTGAQLVELVTLVSDGKVSSSAAKEVLEGVLVGEGDPGRVAEDRDLIQISDSDELERIIAEVVAVNPEAVESYAAGEQKVIGFLVGQVMRATQGKADPKLANQLIRSRLEG